MWEEIGRLQFDFLVARGLLPHHRLADVGCGSLRGGVHFIRYLEAERYFGLDINQSLLDAGMQEVEAHGLTAQRPQLLASSQFELSRFGVEFATFFEAPHPGHVEPIRHEPGSIQTRMDADPSHYSFAEFRQLAEHAGLSVERFGDWDYPRAQRTLVFSLPRSTT